MDQDNDKFLRVIEQHKGIIYKIANSYCNNVEDRKDLVQEIIFQLWRSFGRYNEQYKHSTWIYTIALNVAITFFRKEKTKSKHSLPLNESLLDFTASDPSTSMEGDLDKLQQFINALKELDKALMLLYLEEKSYKEIAEIIGISQTNVATKIGRIKDKLRQSFSQLKPL